MKILTATDYGDRKVIVVCLNSDALEWVHKEGAVGCNPLVAPNPALKHWEWCHNALYNWKLKEHIFEGRNYKKTDTEILAEVKAMYARPAPVVARMPIEGSTF